jgi:hypothetical protein
MDHFAKEVNSIVYEITAHCEIYCLCVQIHCIIAL